MTILAIGAAPISAAHAEWIEGSSKHFVVYADDSPAHVKEMTSNLERFDKAVRTVLKLKEPDVSPEARVTVFVLPSIDDVQKMLGARGKNVAGYYRNDGPAPIAFVPKNSGNDSSQTPATILRHEYTHHVMRSSWGDVTFPTWFSEGFAELFATAKSTSDGGIIIGAVPLYRAYGIDRMNDMPIERLTSGPPNYKDALQGQEFYGRAWLLTHYLIFDKDRAKQLADYISAINAGKPAKEAEALLGLNSTLDLKMNGYGARRTLPSAALSASQLPIGEVSTRPLTPGEAATISVQMRSKNGVDQKLAQEVVAQARTAAAPFPNDPAAQNELAEAEYDAGNYAASEAAADRALAANPKSVHALVYKGMAQGTIAEKAGVTDPAVWTAVRRWYLAANKLEPLYAYPVQLYYESFLAAKQVPTRAAKDALLYGYQLAPQNLTIRQEAARILIDDGKLKAARIALEPIAFDEDPSPLVDAAKKAIAALDANDGAAALEALKPAPPEKPGDKPGEKKKS
ncbi:MAG: hypothetical protein B7Y47_16215 [Sphingomonas sp. 28-63-12]|nr:MAG: hypothetical protein B7Y47_16215 [Sphingomonas sp. 28-63-12]